MKTTVKGILVVLAISGILVAITPQTGAAWPVPDHPLGGGLGPRIPRIDPVWVVTVQRLAAAEVAYQAAWNVLLGSPHLPFPPGGSTPQWDRAYADWQRAEEKVRSLYKQAEAYLIKKGYTRAQADARLNGILEPIAASYGRPGATGCQNLWWADNLLHAPKGLKPASPPPRLSATSLPKLSLANMGVFKTAGNLEGKIRLKAPKNESGQQSVIRLQASPDFRVAGPPPTLTQTRFGSGLGTGPGGPPNSPRTHNFRTRLGR